MKSSQAALLDASAVALSSLCLLHCLALPLLAAALPLFGAWAEAEWVHAVFVAIALPITGFALWRAHRQRPRQQYPRPLAARQLGRDPPLEAGDIGADHRILDRRLIGGGQARQRPQMRQPPQRHQPLDRQGPVQGLALRQIGDGPRHRLARQPLDRRPVQQCATGGRLHQPQQRPNLGRLARTIGADHADQLPRRHGQIDAAYRQMAAQPDVQLLGRQGHHSRRSRIR